MWPPERCEWHQRGRKPSIEHVFVPPQGADFDVVLTDPETGEVLASGTQGGSAVENLEFFVRENQRYQIRIYSYSGQGWYGFIGAPPTPATRVGLDQLHNTNESNGWQVVFDSLPPASGWAITVAIST